MVGMVLTNSFLTRLVIVLLMKLKAMGFSEDAVRWFQSYPSDRHQLVDVSDVFPTRLWSLVGN